MHNNDNDLPDTIKSDDSGNRAPQEQRREPFFSGFEEEDNYEEPDRDTDYASSYHEESLEDDEFDESPQDEDDFTPQAEIECGRLSKMAAGFNCSRDCGAAIAGSGRLRCHTTTLRNPGRNTPTAGHPRHGSKPG